MRVPQVGQGYMKPANEEDYKRDAKGFTAPYLHRRVEKYPENIEYEGDVTPRNYNIAIFDLDSYRKTEFFNRDEDTETSEIP